MYRLMIVDDEDEVREGIIQKTDWQACGFELVGDFTNGRDALDAVADLQPDVIITDICMPFMDGLELAKHVAEEHRDIVVVIITGYEDFEYAKQAIRLKVKEYLLKPINAREITAFLQKMKQELDEQQQKKTDLRYLKIQLNESLPLLRERFLEKMVTTRLSPDEIEQKFRYFDLELIGSSYVAIVGDMDEMMQHSRTLGQLDRELLKFAVFNIMQEVFEQDGNGIVFRTRDDKVAIVFGGHPEQMDVQAQTLVGQAQISVNKYLNLTLSIGIGRTYSELADIAKSYQEALTALDHRFILGNNRIISINDIAYGKQMNTITYEEWEKRLIAALKTGRSELFAQEVQEWMEDLRQNHSTIEECHVSIYKLIVSLMNVLVGTTTMEQKLIFGDNPFAHIAGLKTLDQVKAWLVQISQRMMTHLVDKRSHVTKSQMDAAVTYINGNYMDEDFSLQQVCSHIYLSISYFSALFKQHSGETFIEYLTRIRLEKAKELLTLTSLKTYDIAARVGYGDPQYFSVIFKRNMGLTPKDYRNSMKGEPSL
ncbi:response regulator [Paenibacillus sp. N1-5-1-14]|uniref:response regulator n=1 Tax=Paenibacillus radicibacter TaxID=2972488 RepID=UPI002159A685|nr:response regulator [Paenibacillus radicibacter]MCR8645548.1 response regulator [Paenibacillus radicibacter]